MFHVTINTNPENAGTVSGSGEYYPDDTVLAMAIPNIGYIFENWTIDGVDGPSTTSFDFIITDDVVLTANFSLKTYQITVSANPAAVGTVTGGGTYSSGENVIVEATADATQYIFENWTEGGIEVSADASYQFNATSGRILVANFTLKTYTVTTTANNPAFGSATSDATRIIHGNEVTVRATANVGYEFVNWVDANGTIVSTKEIYTFPVTEDVHLTANFTLITNLNDNTEITDIIVDGVVTTPGIDVMAPCGVNSVSVIVTTVDPNATVEINGMAYQPPHTVDLPNYGNNLITFKVTAENGVDESTYTRTIYNRYPFWDKDGGLVVMHWNNTLSVINNKTVNSDFDFRDNSYRWFRVGESQPFNTGQWWSAGAQGEMLSTTTEYYVEATNIAGKLLITCPTRITLIGISVNVRPNPVDMGQTLYIEADINEELLKGAVIEVYDVSGNCIDYLQAQGRLTPVNVHYATGLYVFVLRGSDGFTKELKVVVK